tara:strand:- start:652 stop:2526 length:1875 start_codon:yes stop_codon:yes gene_type:complete
MAIFDRFRAKTVEPVSTKNSSMVGYFGVGSTQPTNYQYEDLASEGYMKNAIVYRCVNEIAKGASGVPFKICNADGDEIENHPAKSLLNRPNPLQSYSEFMNALFGYLLLSGNSYMLKVAGISNVPKELHLLRPDRITISGGRGAMPARYDYKVNGRTEAVYDVDQDSGFSELKQTKLWNPLDDFYGLSPLNAAAVEVDQHNLSSKHNINLLNNGARPSGAVIFKPKDSDGFATSLTAGQRQQLMTDLNNRFSGTDNAGRPMLLEGDFDWKEMGLSPKDMDFINLKHMSATDIAMCFGVPSQLVGVPDSQTYSNVAEARLALYEETILPMLSKVQSDINEWLMPQFSEDVFFKFDTDEIPALSERRKRIYENVIGAVKEGIMTRNEARERLGLNAIDGADGLLVNASLFPLNEGLPDAPVEEEDSKDYELYDDSKALSDIDSTPSKAMSQEAQRGLDWRKKHKRGGTQVGVTRANQLVDRQKLSLDVVTRMHSYFSRHEVDKQGAGFSPSEKGYPSAGRIAWALWGGDAGQSWAKAKRAQIIAEEDTKAEAGDLSVGDMVSWNSSGGRARGKITKIVKSGKLSVPKTDFTLNASEDNPAALIRIYQGSDPTDVIVGHRFSTLRKA